MKELESAIERRVVLRAFEKLGIISKKINGSGDRSWPDRMFMIPGGKPLFVEFKRRGEEPSPAQHHKHTLLRRLGYEVEVHDDVDQALRAVARAFQAAQVPAHRR